jgi:SAM-dependent methyltransferase
MSRYGYEDAFPAEFYDAVFSERLSPEIGFWVEQAKHASGRTLELASGTGRVLLPIAQAGCEITGIDLSPHMMQKCRERLEHEPEDVRGRVRLVQGNMVDFSTGESYALAIIPARSLQILIEPREQEACLRTIVAHLQPRGRLVIDVFNPSFPMLFEEKWLHEYTRRVDVPLPDGRTVTFASRIAAYHKDAQYNDVELIYYVQHPDGKEERLVQSFPFHYFFRYEMEHLLRLCGFKVVELYGDFDKSAFKSESPEMIFVAEKANP